MPAFYISGGNKIRRGYYLSHWQPTHQDPRSRTFIVKYGHTGEIVAAAALACDAVQILAAAITKAGTTDSTAIRNALHGLQGFQGVTGEIKFDAQGNTTKPAAMIERHDGVPSPHKQRISQ
jgi:branched-chain amino acid transport system substrate-binding protein